jgi:predicted HTH transcriptional regulator
MEAIDDHEYSGGLISLLNAAKSFVVANSKIMWRKQPGGRIEYPEYPERAYEEGIVNGLIHRDYLEVGSEVHIDIFDDRMEIFSPGGMPSGDIVQDLGLHRVSSLRRNPVIADLFQRLDLMERRGSGFGKILRAYDLESHKRGRDFKVLFSSIHMGFTLVLPNLNYGQAIEGLVGEEPMDGSGKADGRS